MGNQIARRTFAEKFDAALVEKQMGKRTLARQLAERRGGRQNVEGIRRLLNKYIGSGVVPTEASRHEIEDALDLERDSLKPDGDDEEEADPTVLRARRRAELVAHLVEAGRDDLVTDLLDLTKAGA